MPRDDVLATHRAFYDAVETGDLDLMASLWVNDADTSCIHPGAEQLRGTEAVLRSWTLLMANVGYIQFFLTDIAVATLPTDADDPDTAVVTCTENICRTRARPPSSRSRAARPSAPASSCATGTGSGGWRFWSRHASPVLELEIEPEEEP